MTDDVSVQTKQQYLDERVDHLMGMHDGNLAAVLGIGSFFQKDLSQPAVDERTIDLIAFVKDLNQFYAKHKFDDPRVEQKRDKIRSINEQQPMYLHQDSNGYRITVVPFDKMVRWTSDNSPIGYFLTGRLQKIHHEVYLNPSDAQEFNANMKAVRMKGVRDVFQCFNFPFIKEQFYDRLVKLSYMSEGLRGWVETHITRKPQKILKANREKFMEAYEPLIKEYCNNSDMVKLDEYCLCVISDASAVRRRLKTNKYAYAKVLLGLEAASPDPVEFFTGKMQRVLHLPDNRFTKFIGNRLYPLLFNRIKKRAQKAENYIV